MEGFVDLGNWLHTEMVYLPTDPCCCCCCCCDNPSSSSPSCPGWGSLRPQPGCPTGLAQ